VEALVAAAVATMLIGTAMTVALSSRDLMTTDEQRTRLNQSLRSSMDLLGIDVRQTGERLPTDFPAIEIVDGADGAPDGLILRRNLLDEVLPLCEGLAQGAIDEEVRVALGGDDPPPGCAPVPDGDGDGWPDNIGAWRAHRDAQGGQVPVYLFNPLEAAGEWFLFDDDGSTSHFLHRGDGEPWQEAYAVDQQVRVYMLEERVYGLTDGLLQFSSSASAATLNVTGNVVDFQVRAVLEDGSVQDGFDSGDSWTELSALEVTLVARVDDGSGMTRELTTRFFPRNVLSN
jgi:type IV pilus assembly protein PilW